MTRDPPTGGSRSSPNLRRVSDTPWQDVLDTAPDAMLIIGPQGRIGIVNRQLETMFGYQRGELVGAKIETLVPERVREVHRHHLHAFMAEPTLRAMGHGMELLGVRKDGSELAVEVSLSPIEHEVGTIVSVAVRDVTERRKAADQFRALLDTAPDAMVIFGDDRRIRLVNRRLEEVFGYERGDLIGQPVDVLVRDLVGVRSDGTEFPVEMTSSPLVTDEGTLVSAAIRDATERVETERRLRELDVLKDELLSVVSHELRTPLTAITGFAQLLLARADRIDDHDRADLLGRIARNAGEMDRLVGQLLDLSRLDAGHVAVHATALPLREAVQTCVRSLATDIGARVEIDIADDISVRADLHALDRVLSNLVTNGAKFSPAGTPVVVKGWSDGDVVTVSVADEGVGIPPEEHENVFDRFYQLGTGERGPRHGTGIGLSIVRRYVELLGGRVWVESQLGRGATVFFSRPRP